MSIDDLTLMAFVDGELSAAERDVVEAATAADPALKARADAFRMARSAARDAFHIAPDPRDAALAALIAGSAKASTPGVGERLRGWFGGLTAPRVAAWGALATACFAAGIAVGVLRPHTGFALDRRGAIADAGLVKVLDQRAAADGPDAHGRAVGLTFRATDGRWCRSFQSADNGVAGLACRRDGRWQAEAVAPFAASSGELRTASSETPPAVLAAVDALIDGDTLDAGAEREAIRGRWR